MPEACGIKLDVRTNELVNIFNTIGRVETHFHLDNIVFIAQELDMCPKLYSFDLTNYIPYSSDLESDLIFLKRYAFVEEMYPSSLYVTGKGNETAQNRCSAISKFRQVKNDELTDLARILMISRRYRKPVKSSLVKKKTSVIFKMSEKEYSKGIHLYQKLSNNP